MKNDDEVTVFVPQLMAVSGLEGSHRLVARKGKWTEISYADGPRAGDFVATSGIALAGLVDMHAHFGIGPYALSMDTKLTQGTTTLCSQGDAGSANFNEWLSACRDHAITVRMALNIGSNGEALRDCLTNLEPDFLDRAVQTALDNPHIVRLIAVNLSERSLGSADPKAILRAAHKAAEITGLSLMLAMAPDHVMSIDAQLETLRPGDIVTYCYRSQPWCLFPEEGPRQTIIDALARGVLLDIAHGSEAFDPEVARRAVALGLPPSAVSSGIKISESGHPKPLSLPNVMQRMHVAGMLLDDILRGVTTIPSKILGFTDGTGSFVVGGRADLTMLDLESATWSAKQLLVAGQTLR